MPLVELGVVEGAELRSEAAECLDEPELHADQVDGLVEVNLAREIEPGLGLALHISERLPGSELAGDQDEMAVAREDDIAKSVGCLERATNQAETGTDRLHPRRDDSEQ